MEKMPPISPSKSMTVVSHSAVTTTCETAILTDDGKAAARRSKYSRKFKDTKKVRRWCNTISEHVDDLPSYTNFSLCYILIFLYR